MFNNKYPYTDFHELNLDYVLKQLADFREELDTISETIYQRVMEQVQPQIDDIAEKVNTLSANFEAFKNEIRLEQATFEASVNSQIADLNIRFAQLVNTVNSLIEQAKLYSDIQNENLYNKIIEDINNGVIGLGDVKVINYITGEVMTVQQMFDYLCMFHLTNPLTYTQAALKGKTYNEVAALNLTYTLPNLFLPGIEPYETLSKVSFKKYIS